MFAINIAHVRKAQQAIKSAPAPNLVISIVGSTPKPVVPITKRKEATEAHTAAPIAKKTKPADGRDSTLVAKCWNEFNELKTERARLSNQIHQMVEAGATVGELKQHYRKIKDYQPELQRLFKIARHAEQYGTLPDLQKETPTTPSLDLFSLKDTKRKLIDRRCKLQDKIKKGKAKNPSRITAWQLQLDQANAEYEAIDMQIKQMEGKA